MDTPTFKRHKTDGGETEYRTEDGRFVISPNWRSAQRGPADRVADGFAILDTFTGVHLRQETLADAKKTAARALRNATEFKDANVVELHLSPDFGAGSRPWTNLSEIWGVDADGKRHYAGMVEAPSRAEGRAHLEALLDTIGRTDLLDTTDL